jgi:hypothetical protein
MLNFIVAATYQPVKHLTTVPPELLLITSVLTRAICDATSPFNLPKKERRRARAWICNWGSVLDAPPFSFPWVCTQLNLNPFQVRKIVLQLKHKKKHGLYSGRYTNECLASFLNIDTGDPFRVTGFKR